ncbi:hypothetical protein CN918_29375 [Priestia megaterium]|nr:hypothetical protein CN918_29375 [Priestia megaterium]
MITMKLNEITLKALQVNNIVRIEVGPHTVKMFADDKKISAFVYEYSSENQSSIIYQPNYEASEESLQKALNDIQTFVELHLHYNFHIIFSVDDGDMVDGVGCRTLELAEIMSTNMLDSFRDCYNSIEYIRVIDNQGKVFYELDDEQENVLRV